MTKKYSKAGHDKATFAWFFIGAFAYTMVIPPVFGAYGRPTEMGIAVGLGGLLMAFASLDKLKWFKVLGMEARIREAIAEATATLQELRELAKATAATVLSTVQMSGRLGGYADDQKEEIKNEILSVLDSLGISKEEQEQVLDFWHACIEFDYASNILGGCRVPDPALVNIKAEWKAQRGGGIAGRPSPQQLREFFADYDLLNSVHEDRLQDYEFYCKKRTHRRPEEWRRRSEWRI